MLYLPDGCEPLYRFTYRAWLTPNTQILKMQDRSVAEQEKIFFGRLRPKEKNFFRLEPIKSTMSTRQKNSVPRERRKGRVPSVASVATPKGVIVMRVPFVGIVTGLRFIEGDKKTSDFGELDVIQVGTKDHRTSLIHLHVQDMELLEYLLSNYSSGELKWISCIIRKVSFGREDVWMLEKVLNLEHDVLKVKDENDGRTVTDDDDERTTISDDC